MVWKPLALSSVPEASDSRPLPPGLAAVAAARRMLYALEGGEDAERRALAMLDLHHLAEPAAMLAGAAGVRRGIPSSR